MLQITVKSASAAGLATARKELQHIPAGDFGGVHFDPARVDVAADRCYPVYDVEPPTGAGQVRLEKSVACGVMLLAGDRLGQKAAVYVDDNDVLREVFIGQFAERFSQALRLMADEGINGRYEPRLLRASELYYEALWVKALDGGPDYVVPLQPGDPAAGAQTTVEAQRHLTAQFRQWSAVDDGQDGDSAP
ncbi:hypothetical protein [Duganella sp. Dugasp56]|uniref:hypothetical protein n=1 Tax=Duganella sp. Dugasp56 TaxID=3243046 RepID=UPI00159E57E5